MWRMAECLGEEMASELARGGWRNVQNLKKEEVKEVVRVWLNRVEMILLMRRFGG